MSSANLVIALGKKLLHNSTLCITLHSKVYKTQQSSNVKQENHGAIRVLHLCFVNADV